MKGMTATQVIVALALGLIVIVGLGYLVWTWVGKGSGALNEQDCRARAFVYCSVWARKGYDEKPSGKDFASEDDAYAPGCKSYSWASSLNQASCEELLSSYWEE